MTSTSQSPSCDGDTEGLPIRYCTTIPTLRLHAAVVWLPNLVGLHLETANQGNFFLLWVAGVELFCLFFPSSKKRNRKSRLLSSRCFVSCSLSYSHTGPAQQTLSQSIISAASIAETAVWAQGETRRKASCSAFLCESNRTPWGYIQGPFKWLRGRALEMYVCWKGIPTFHLN